MKPTKILDGNYLMPWDVKSDDPEINRLNEILFSSDHDLIEENQNTMPSHTSTDEDCLHKASRQSDMGNKAQQKHQKTSARQSTKKTKLLEDPDVKRWYDNLARSSIATAEIRLRKLGRFCELHNMTPAQLAELGMKDLRTVTDLLQDHIAWMEQENKAPQYTKAIMTAAKSWLAHFDIQVTRKLKIRNVDSTPTLEGERVPEGAELAEIFARADLFTGAAISLIAKAGLRPESLGNQDGTDGLMMKDLPDIVIQQGTARSLTSQTRIIVRRTISKARHQYMTFLTASGTKKLLAYLNDRLVMGEILNADSPVMSPDYIYKTNRGRNSAKKFLPTQRILKKIRDTLRPRFGWRPYVFRAYFDTQLLIAESRGKIAHDFRVFFMGHKGSIEAKYTTNKGVLAEALVSEMREAFKRSEEFLDLEVREEDPLLKKKQDMQLVIDKATPEQLGRMQEMLHNLDIGKIDQAREL
ncbi:MAG TPA: site-specific integrase [Candidatus Nitrosotalea sp.]|nr:site-specific integrase [Candidatus Nitrosotalea sp.]